jgi:hypothetical protein
MHYTDLPEPAHELVYLRPLSLRMRLSGMRI